MVDIYQGEEARYVLQCNTLGRSAGGSYFFMSDKQRQCVSLTRILAGLIILVDMEFQRTISFDLLVEDGSILPQNLDIKPGAENSGG
jgi:hypothetical protein